MQNERNTSRFIDIIELMHITSLKKTSIYKLISLGKFHPHKIGRRTVFLETEAFSFVDAITNDNYAENLAVLMKAKQQPVTAG